MALYKYTQYITQSDDPAFDAVHQPGANARLSGIYRCTGCDYEVASNQGQSLPPQNHHQHLPSQGPIRWQLNAYAVHKA